MLPRKRGQRLWAIMSEPSRTNPKRVWRKWKQEGCNGLPAVCAYAQKWNFCTGYHWTTRSPDVIIGIYPGKILLLRSMPKGGQQDPLDLRKQPEASSGGLYLVFLREQKNLQLITWTWDLTSSHKRACLQQLVDWVWRQCRLEKYPPLSAGRLAINWWFWCPKI